MPLKKLSRLALLPLISLPILFMVLQSCVQLRWLDPEMTEFFYERNLPLRIAYHKTKNHTIRTLITGTEGATNLLFIHGSPASTRIFKTYFLNDSLQKQFRIVGVDRPGYGGSGFGKTERSVLRQSQSVSQVIRALDNGKPWIVVASSFGGPVACCVAGWNQQLVKAVVLIAPALNPESDRLFWFNKPLSWPIVKQLLPVPIRVANEEKIYHAKALREIKPIYRNVTQAVYYLQGTADNIVNTDNAGFLQSQAECSRFTSCYEEGLGHSLLWDRQQKVLEFIFLADRENANRLSDNSAANGF